MYLLAQRGRAARVFLTKSKPIRGLTRYEISHPGTLYVLRVQMLNPGHDMNQRNALVREFKKEEKCRHSTQHAMQDRSS